MVDIAGAMELRRRVLLKRYDPRCVSAAQRVRRAFTKAKVSKWTAQAVM
jgi:hypothetical protein